MNITQTYDIKRKQINKRNNIKQFAFAFICLGVAGAVMALGI